MKKKYSTKRALIASVLALCMCFSMLVGTTFAWFTDSVTSANNIIKSGSLDVTMEWKDATATGKQQSYKDASEGAIFNYDKWEPGYVEAKNIKIGNAGTLALKYQVAIVATGEISKLADVIDVYYAEGEYTLSGRSMTELTKLGTLTDVLSKLSDTANGDLEAGKSDTITLALKMQESAGNEYMNLSIGSEFAVKCFATQLTSESDSFGTDYDKDADFPHFLFGSAMVVENATAPYTLPLKNFKGGKQGSATVRPASVDPNATDITATVKEVLTDSNFTVYDSATQSVITLDVTVTGLVPGNTTPVKIETHIPAGLTGVELYHKDTKIESTYKEENGTGILIFESATFSPFNIVYDTIPVEEEVNPQEQPPKAIVVESPEFEDVALAWSNSLGLMPSNDDQSLEAVYTFTAPHTSETVENSKYRDWHCDFYVMCSGESATIPEGALVLGGNYGTWGWVGFDSPEVDANVEIPLLGSVTQNPWTYEQVVDLVGTFICGVAHNNHELDGETFTVILRLTNPDDATDIVDAAKIEYTFPECGVVTNADELAAAVAAGKTNLYLADGEYDVYGCAGKTLTLNGSRNAVLKVMNEGEDGCDYGFGDSAGIGNITFNGLTIDTTANTGNYKGYAYMSATYNDCAFVGNGFATVNAGPYVFNNCTFGLNGYIWTWGAASIDFNNCEFTGDSRTILAHGGASTVININDCDFAATTKGQTGAGDWTAIVEIDPTGANTYTINFNGNNTVSEFYSGYTRVKDGSTGHIVNGLN